MEKLTPCEVVNDFRDNGREPHEYVDDVNELLLAYCKSEDYHELLPVEQKSLHKRFADIKNLLKGIARIDPVYLVTKFAVAILAATSLVLYMDDLYDLIDLV